MAYTFVSMRIELLRRLGGRTDSTSAVRAGEFLNSAQLKLAEANFQIPFFEGVATVTFTEGQDEINILQATPTTPLTDSIIEGDTTIVDSRSYVNNFSDLIGIRLVQRLPLETNSNDIGWRMHRMSWAEWREGEQVASTGPPTRWARNGWRLAVDPTPDDEYQLKIDFRRRPPRDIIEVDGEWQEIMLQIAESIGWRSFGQPDLGLAALNMLPANVGRILSTPLDGSEWEALWDDELSMQPRMG